MSRTECPSADLGDPNRSRLATTKQPVVKVGRRTEADDAPGSQGAKRENTGSMQATGNAAGGMRLPSRYARRLPRTDNRSGCQGASERFCRFSSFIPTRTLRCLALSRARRAGSCEQCVARAARHCGTIETAEIVENLHAFLAGVHGACLQNGNAPPVFRRSGERRIDIFPRGRHAARTLQSL
jgi:hypothetical protein